MENPSAPHVRVGLGVILQKNGRVLLGERLGPHGGNTWAFPGGHLEFGETWAECASREAKEETDLDISNVRMITATNDIFKETNKHYVTLYVTAECQGDPKLMEPHKCLRWEWFDTDKLPEPLFLALQNLLHDQPDLWQKVILKNN